MRTKLALDVEPGDLVQLDGTWVKVTSNERWDRDSAGRYSRPHQRIEGVNESGRVVRDIVPAGSRLPLTPPANA